MAKIQDLKVLEPGDRKAWRRWLEKNHDRSPGVMLVISKKGSARRELTYDEAVEEAVSFGWIDGRAQSLDDERYKLLVTPRKPGSGWSKSNKRRVEKLTKQGLMTPAGMEKVRSAKKDGSWSKLDEVEDLEVPDDLDRALDANRAARKNFDAFPGSSRKMYLYWIAEAKRPETRSRRIEEVVRLAEQNRKTRLA